MRNDLHRANFIFSSDWDFFSFNCVKFAREKGKLGNQNLISANETQLLSMSQKEKERREGIQTKRARERERISEIERDKESRNR